VSALAGVDGAPGGWAIAKQLNGVPLLSFAPDLSRLGRQVDSGEVEFVAIDMPIGLPGRRQCDFEARRLLGKRRSSVFPAPHRSVLGSPDYAEARRRSIDATGGTSLTIQAFNLIPKIDEVDRLLHSPRRRQRIVEAHPELAFMRLNNGPLDDPKSTATGRDARRALLEEQFGSDLVASALKGPGVPIIDALDALALLVTANRLADGSAHRLGDSERDSEGQPVQIVY